MGISPERIEAAARAICEADPLSPAPDAPIMWGMKPAKAWEPRAAILKAAIEAGLFCHPPRAWVAPWEATGAMIDAAVATDGMQQVDGMVVQAALHGQSLRYNNGKPPLVEAYEAMREAHLQPDTTEDKT